MTIIKKHCNKLKKSMIMYVKQIQKRKEKNKKIQITYIIFSERYTNNTKCDNRIENDK